MATAPRRYTQQGRQIVAGTTDNDLAQPIFLWEIKDDAEDTEDGRGIHPLPTAQKSVLDLSDATASPEPVRLFILATWWDHVLLLIVLPFLLVVQFATSLQDTSYYTNDTGDPTRQFGLSSHDVYTVICLYVVAAYLYKKSLQDSRWVRESSFWNANDAHPMHRHVVALVPEIIMDLVLGLVFLVSAPVAALVLALATLALAGTGILLSLHTLYHCEFHSPWQ